MAERDSGQPLGSALDAPDITPLLEDFKTNIDKLETGLKPLLEQDLSETLSKLPVLDKAKLYCLLTYAIESMLSSYLSLNGTDVTKHKVQTELKRVEQYFQKVRKAAMPESKPKLSVDKDAAHRFVKAGIHTTPPQPEWVDSLKRKLDQDAAHEERDLRRRRKWHRQSRNEKNRAKEGRSEGGAGPSSS